MERRDLGNALLCALVTLLAIALCIPIAECGFNDDWSYTKTALDLAHTGHLVYNGWAAAMLGAQAYWGALWIKLFGFSFLIVRLSTAPLAAGCAALLYALHRRSGLPPSLSVFGALVLTLSPIFIPNAASFMTEIPGQFFFLLTVYGYTRTAEVLDRAVDGAMTEGQRTRFYGWLAFALAAGLLGGTVRQIIWVAPVLMPLYLLMRNQTRTRVPSSLLPLAASALIALAAAVRLSDWFGDQPYAIHERILLGFGLLFGRKSSSYIPFEVVTIGYTFVAAILPIASVQPAVWLSLIRKQVRPLMLGAAVVIIALVLLLPERIAMDHFRDFPWLGNTFDRFPLYLGMLATPAFRVTPIFSVAFWRIFSILVIALTNLWIAIALVFVYLRRQKAVDPTEGPTFLGGARLPAALQLQLVFAAIYMPLLIVKALVPESYGIFDRYLLPEMPVGTIIALIAWQRATERERLPAVCWAVLAGYAFYGIAQTHDYYSQLRGRLAETNLLESHGVSRTHILGGFEYDAWTQITIAGHYNDVRIEKPRGIYIPPQPLSFDTWYAFYQYTPVIQPDYVVCLAPHSDLLDTDVPPADYTCWLPPLHRKLVVQATQDSLINAMSPHVNP